MILLKDFPGNQNKSDLYRLAVTFYFLVFYLRGKIMSPKCFNSFVHPFSSRGI